MKRIAGRYLKQVIAENKLSTVEKYEAYRKAHTGLSLPQWRRALGAFIECGGWKFEIRSNKFRKTPFGRFEKFSEETLQKAVR